MASKRKAAMVESMPKKAKLLKTSTPRFQKTSVSATVEIDQKFAPNFGVGGFLYGKKYYVGFSIPKVINTEFENLSKFIKVKKS